MFASREEAEKLAERLEGEHEVVGLRTREITEDDDFGTVVFAEDGTVEPGEAGRGE